MKRDFRFLEHTADIMFEAYGKSYPQALENAALALFSVIGKAKPKKRAVLSLSAHSLEELTVQALSELLAYMDIHQVVFAKMKVLDFDPSRNWLEMEAWGEKVRPRDHVKAVTYHELMVKNEDGKWTIRILLDV
ncbi:MAG: archease [Candidatus Micrarchaeota archaeon]|nr:archease [Candidatus Micrarchaeota archaeon]